MIPNRSIVQFFRNDPHLKMYCSLSKELRDYVGGKTVATSGSSGSVSDVIGSRIHPSLGGSAKHFNGRNVGQYHITVGAASDYQFGASLTAMAWVKCDDASQYDWFLAKHSASTVVGWNILRSSNNLMRFQVNNGGTDDTWGGPYIYPGVWYHVAMTLDGATLRGYVNGMIVARMASTKNPNQTLEPFRIGNRRTGSAEGCVGDVQEVAFFDRALDPVVIAQYYRHVRIEHAYRRINKRHTGAPGSKVTVFDASYRRRRAA